MRKIGRTSVWKPREKFEREAKCDYMQKRLRRDSKLHEGI